MQGRFIIGAREDVILLLPTDLYVKCPEKAKGHGGTTNFQGKDWGFNHLFQNY